MSTPPPGPPGTQITLELASSGGGMRRMLRGGGGPHVLLLTPAEVVVEHAGTLRAPLRFAPGSVTVASVDAGPANAPNAGRFPILHRIAPDRVLPRDLGIDGWLWTGKGGSACAVLGEDAPNVALLFSPPLTGERVKTAFQQDQLAELAKRSPLGDPALVGLLLRVANADAATQALGRFGMLKDVTDRDVPPAQRRHLPGDKPANPEVGADRPDRTSGSVPPPGKRA